MWLAVNSASGSYSEAALGDLRAAFGSGAAAPARTTARTTARTPARTIARTIDCQQDGLPGRDELEDAGVARLAVFAGDGTLSRYLGRLEAEGWRGVVLPLPGGTQNLLCGEMFGNRTGPEIARMLARGELGEMRRNCMRCGDHTALAEILMGPGARWSDVREDFREGELGAVLHKSVEITKEAATGPLVWMAEPRVGREDGYPGLHFSIPDTAITVRGYHMDNWAEWLKQGLAIAMRDFRDGPYDDLGTVPRARCRSTDGREIDLMVDGERASVGHEVVVTRDRFGLTLLGLPA